MNSKAKLTAWIAKGSDIGMHDREKLTALENVCSDFVDALTELHTVCASLSEWPNEKIIHTVDSKVAKWVMRLHEVKPK